MRADTITSAFAPSVSRVPTRGPWRRVRAVTAFAAFVASMVLLPGEAPATIAEQRARLPPPATCQDPVAGVWRSHDFDERHVDWTIFTLEIERVPGSETALVGRIENHTWYAEKGQSEPPACAGNLEYIVGMDAEGSYLDGAIDFGGVGQWRLDDVPCGRFTMGYNLDNFSGVIDPDLQEFQSVNNDGGRAVDDPTVFRRVACSPQDAGKAPTLVIDPPPFFPPEDETSSSAGCGVG
jgi:hypothetical protein